MPIFHADNKNQLLWMLRYKGGPRQSGLSVDLGTPGRRARQKRDILSTLKKKPIVRSKSPFSL
jgi:hypothetical protein